MEKINARYYNFFEVGDDFPVVIMGVLNLSPESFYSGSVYEETEKLENATIHMVRNGAKILDLGARSTAPWSQKISIDEEIDRLIPAMEKVCTIIPDDVLISIDTQFEVVASKAYEISKKFNKKIILNDVSCLKTDLELTNFLIDNDLPIILMASKQFPGDLLTIDEILREFKKTVLSLENKGYDTGKLILDPGIGHWIKQKTYKYDLKIINELSRLRELKRPILVAISRKSFIGTALNKPDPKDRLNGTLAATTIAIYNGAHIVRTHDVSLQLQEIVSMAKLIRQN
jgi:dihydropteroate synthase